MFPAPWADPLSKIENTKTRRPFFAVYGLELCAALWPLRLWAMVIVATDPAFLVMLIIKRNLKLH